MNRTIYSIAQVNEYIRNMFRQDIMLQQILVRGEVSNCKYHSSGHIYFTLKDASGVLNCVMWAMFKPRGLKFPMKDGDEVIVYGYVSVYEKTGQYQLYAKQIVLDGVGQLQAKFEQLKKKLEEEGMFDEQYKKPIPSYVRTLGIVTADTGEAVHDIITTARRRNPYVRILLKPALVQGPDAPASLIHGLETLDSLPDDLRPDVIILGRGGGSMEDLWCFNDEKLAEAVFACRTPVISAVGHEPDYVITDYVADRRAPTPTGAAELAVFDWQHFTDGLRERKQQLTAQMQHRLDRCRQELTAQERLLLHLSPQSRIREQRAFTEHAEQRLRDAMAMALERAWHTQERYSAEALSEALQRKTEIRRSRLAVLSASLDALSPLKRLSGGFGYVRNVTGEPRAVLSAAQVHPGDALELLLKDGKIAARAEHITMVQP